MTGSWSNFLELNYPLQTFSFFEISPKVFLWLPQDSNLHTFHFSCNLYFSEAVFTGLDVKENEHMKK